MYDDGGLNYHPNPLNSPKIVTLKIQCTVDPMVLSIKMGIRKRDWCDLGGGMRDPLCMAHANE